MECFHSLMHIRLPLKSDGAVRVGLRYLPAYPADIISLGTLLFVVSQVIVGSSGLAVQCLTHPPTTLHEVRENAVDHSISRAVHLLITYIYNPRTPYHSSIALLNSPRAALPRVYSTTTLLPS